MSKTMKIDVLSAFPELIKGVFQESMLKQAQKKKKVEIRIWDLRSFTNDRHRTVDDAPYGGGPGMIMKPEPFFEAWDALAGRGGRKKPHTMLMSPQGRRFDQGMAESMSREDHLVFLCGHYRGVDERVVRDLVDDEISIGDYVLTGGELAAAVIIDAVVRLLPGVLGNFDSAEADSIASGMLDHPHYTRPEEYRGMKVPDVLLSGNHAEIQKWREEQALIRTRQKRPDLLEARSRRQR